MSYSHLTIDQRNHLYQLRQEQNLSQRELATLVGCSQSTICRELQRNKTEQGWYVPDKAQVLTDKRRKDSKKKFNNITDWILHEVKTRLKDYHSPEQISGKLKKEGGEWISYETIYQMIYQNYQGLGIYQQYCNCSGGHEGMRVAGSKNLELRRSEPLCLTSRGLKPY